MKACRKCGARLRVTHSKRTRCGEEQLQYLRCVQCDCRAKAIVPAESIWRRKR